MRYYLNKSMPIENDCASRGLNGGYAEKYKCYKECEPYKEPVVKISNMYSHSYEFRNSRAVTQAEIAVSREKATARVRHLLREWDGSLVCLSMNIPGAYKQFPLASLCFAECRRITEITLEAGGFKFAAQDTLKQDSTGDRAYYLVDGKPEEIKKLLCEVEDNHPLGRLFNIDLFARCAADTGNIGNISRIGRAGDAGYTGIHNIRKITRAAIGKEERLCMLCDKYAFTCQHARMHSMDELVSNMLDIMWSWVRNYLSERVNSTAMRALCCELATTPKPGLVDRMNCGAHTDMDFFTFIDSMSELLPFFQECAVTGFDCASISLNTRFYGSGCEYVEPPLLLKAIRGAGELAHAKMIRVTGGANTHKGLIFSLGILCAAYGWLVRTKTIFTMGELFDLCRDISMPVMSELAEMSIEDARTNGEKVYARYGFTGIRGEVSHGFASVRKYSLPMLCSMLERGHTMNDAGIAAFIALLAHVDDTTILHRSNAETLRDIQQAAADFLASGPAMSEIKKWAHETDRQFIERNISAGGCADLLAVTFFVWHLFKGYSPGGF